MQEEQYDFIVPRARADRPGVVAFKALLRQPATREALARLGMTAMTCAGGIVLCGGKSTRMGMPKATLPFGPETMLQRVVRLLGTVVSPIVVVAAREQALPELPADVIVTRDEREATRAARRIARRAEGAAAIGRRRLRHELRRAAARARLRRADARAARRARHRRDGDRRLPHPLSAVYRRDVLPQVESLLAQDRLRPVFLFDAVRTRRVPPAEMRAVDPELRTLRNLNTREDYEAALRTRLLVRRAGFSRPRAG